MTSADSDEQCVAYRQRDTMLIRQTLTRFRSSSYLVIMKPRPAKVPLAVELPMRSRLLIDKIRSARLRRGQRVTLRELVIQALDLLGAAERRRSLAQGE